MKKEKIVFCVLISILFLIIQANWSKSFSMVNKEKTTEELKNVKKEFKDNFLYIARMKDYNFDQYKDIIEEFERVVQNATGEEAKILQFSLGLLYEINGKYNNAIMIYTNFILANKVFIYKENKGAENYDLIPITYKYLGDVYKKQGNIEKALYYYNEVLLKYADSKDEFFYPIAPSVYFLIAQIYEKQKLYDKAINIYEKTKNKYGNQKFQYDSYYVREVLPESDLSIAKIYVMQKHYSMAMDIFRNIVENSKGEREVYCSDVSDSYRGIALGEITKFTDVKNFKKEMQYFYKRKKFEIVLWCCNLLLDEYNNTEESLKYYLLLLKEQLNDFDRASCLIKIARIYRKLGYIERAKDKYNEIIRQYGNVKLDEGSYTDLSDIVRWAKREIKELEK